MEEFCDRLPMSAVGVKLKTEAWGAPDDESSARLLVKTRNPQSLKNPRLLRDLEQITSPSQDFCFFTSKMEIIIPASLPPKITPGSVGDSG